MKQLNAVKPLEWMLKSRPFIVFGINITLIILFTLTNKYFFSGYNFEAIGYGLLSVGIVSIGMMMVMISGGFDLSVGSTLAFTGVIASKLMEFGVPIIVSAIAALVLGALIGYLNGVLITRIGINPFIATLGTMSMVRGLSLAITQGMPIYGLPSKFAFLGEGRIAGFPFAILLMIVLVIVFDQFMSKTPQGRLFYYTGGNEEAAKLSGIQTKKVKIAGFVTVGVLAGFAGVILASRMMSMMATAGTGLELKAIAACIIGGAALSGGEGTIIGAFLGTILVGLIENILILSNVSSYWQQFSAGAILVFVVSFDIVIRQIRKKR